MIFNVHGQVICIVACHVPLNKAYVNQAESLGTLPTLIGWNGLLLVDTSATARLVAKHPFSYLNTCKCHFFTILRHVRKL